MTRLRFVIALLALLFYAIGAEAQFYFCTIDRTQGLPDNYVSCITQNGGYMWFGTIDGISRFDGYRHRIFTLTDATGRADNNVTAFYCTKDGSLKAATVTGNTYIYHGDGFKHTAELWTGENKKAATKPPHIQDRQGRQWQATDNKGLRVIAPGRKPFYSEQWITKNEGNFYSLPSNHLNTLFYNSAEDVLWVGTSKAGAAFANLNVQAISIVNTTQDEDVSFVQLLDDGTHLVGHDGKGLVLIGRDGVLIKTWNTTNSILKSDAVTGCMVDCGGRLLIATYGGGIYCFQNGALTELLASGNAKLAYCRRMAYDAQRRLWIGSMKDGLNRMEQGGRLTNFNHQNSILHTSCITDMAFDTITRRLYVATSTGLCYISPQGKIEQAKDDPKDDARLSLQHIRTMTIDDSGRLYIGTDQGIRIYDQQFRRVSTPVSHIVPPLLLNQEILALASSAAAGTKDSLVVATTAKGIYVISNDLTCYGYGREYGLGTVAFAKYALSIAPDGTILAGGFGQFAIIDTQTLQADHLPQHDVKVSDVIVNGEPKNLQHHNELDLSYKDEAYIDVSTFDYAHLSTTIFLYRVDESERITDAKEKGGWLTADGNRIRLEGLSPGNHYVTVQAAGLGQTKELKLQIHVGRPWWGSVWAILLYIIIGVGGLYWLNRKKTQEKQTTRDYAGARIGSTEKQP